MQSQANPATGAIAEHSTPVNTFYRHKTGDDDDDDGSRGADAADDEAGHGRQLGTLGGGEVEISAMSQAAGSSSKQKIKLPEVACTICGKRFTDQELFAKHIQVHELELYADNPLAAKFDTGPSDPNQFYLDHVNDNGKYACDICTKTFTQMTALKVHRKWHFRDESKQNPAKDDHSAFATSQTHNVLQLPGLQAVGLMPNPRPLKSLNADLNANTAHRHSSATIIYVATSTSCTNRKSPIGAHWALPFTLCSQKLKI